MLLAYADRMFPAFSIRSRAVISVTRNADISPEDEAYEVDEDYRQHMRKIVKSATAWLRSVWRSRAVGMRRARLLCRRLNLSREQVFFSKSASADGLCLCPGGAAAPGEPRRPVLPAYTPRWLTAALRPRRRVLPQVLRHDVLLFYPFQSMDPFLHLVREAASDPCVLSIKITIYRLASKAKLAEYLCAAAENGKEVTVLMELRARFDEQNNIQWAERMEEAGCTLLYGAEDIKVHPRSASSPGGSVGGSSTSPRWGRATTTKKTARQYTDLCLMSARPELGADAAALFQNLATANLDGTYERLLVSPISCGTGASSSSTVRSPRGAGVYFPEAELHHRPEAHRQAGPGLPGRGGGGDECAGICCLLPGIPGLTDRVTVFSIVGRYLEHTRIYRFGCGEDADLFLSSADFMTRNTERRVEVACPILDPELRRRVFHITDVLISDNVKARQLGPDGLWRPRENGGSALLQPGGVPAGSGGGGRTAPPTHPALLPEGKPLASPVGAAGPRLTTEAP